MNLFGVGLPEMLVILAVALMVFGPRKLPEISRNLAKAMKTLQQTSRDFETAFNQEAVEMERAAAAVVDPPSLEPVLDPVPTEMAAVDGDPVPLPEEEMTPSVASEPEVNLDLNGSMPENDLAPTDPNRSELAEPELHSIPAETQVSAA